MIKANFLKDLVNQLTDALPSQIGTLKKDFEKNCQRILSSSLAKFDLITREEFDTQKKVLARTRKKVEALEKHIKEIEMLLNEKT